MAEDDDDDVTTFGRGFRGGGFFECCGVSDGGSGGFRKASLFCKEDAIVELILFRGEGGSSFGGGTLLLLLETPGSLMEFLKVSFFAFCSCFCFLNAANSASRPSFWELMFVVVVTSFRIEKKLYTIFSILKLVTTTTTTTILTWTLPNTTP
ncbi:MAG: hypothetical protein ACTSUE_22755 [Promethearchaeota archaeon]